MSSARPGEIAEVLLSEERIRARVGELGREIARDYAGRPLVVVGVLKGSFVFLADLIRAIDLPISVDFIGISSYLGTSSTGVVKITSDLSRPIEGQHVLLVEDIVDTGLTMRYLLENLETRRPASLQVCALLEKPARARVKVPIAYRGFVIDDVFVVGYGLDWDGKMRNLPYVGVARP
jgi:hypoxanthine phosphoribosyltransferase